MKRAVVVLVLAGCGNGAPPPIVAVPPAGNEGPRAIASSLPVAVDAGPPPVELSIGERLLRQWSLKGRDLSYDYGVEGGIQTFWDHRPAGVTVAQVATWAGVAIFASGPHSREDLELAAEHDFGHYNPAFVTWLVDKAGASARDSEARALTQDAYDQKLKPLAEIFFYTLQQARHESECFGREENAYRGLIAKKALPPDYYERWFYFLNPAFCDRSKRGLSMSNVPSPAFTFFMDNGFDGGIDGNVTKTVTGFWLRRAMDGTMDAFAKGLESLIRSYEPELIDHAYRQAPGVKTIDAYFARGLPKAQACKGKAKKVRVEITANPDGSVKAVPDVSATAVLQDRKIYDQAHCVGKAFEGGLSAFDGRAITYNRDVVFAN